MHTGLPLTAVDYVVVGHLSIDLTPEGPRLGGTAAYAALTACSLGRRVGVVTSVAAHAPLKALEGCALITLPSQHSTTFENIYTPDGRIQYLRAKAADIPLQAIPTAWRTASILHLGPIAAEMEPYLPDDVVPGLLGLTLQGWLRRRDASGRVQVHAWEYGEQPLRSAGAVILSVEDVGGDEEQIESLAAVCPLLVVTEGAAGARLYWNGDLRRFTAPAVLEVDATGAGDIFAAAFFVRLQTTRNPWEAARFATRLASASVTRSGLAGIPTAEEIQSSLMEVF
ncbi:MAG: PfkB family carbohydrate kinase [Candidatus Villigracilaceae bacterium]